MRKTPKTAFVTLRLEPSDSDLITRLADTWKTTRSDAVRRAVRGAAENLPSRTVSLAYQVDPVYKRLVSAATRHYKKGTKLYYMHSKLRPDAPVPQLVVEELLKARAALEKLLTPPYDGPANKPRAYHGYKTVAALNRGRRLEQCRRLLGVIKGSYGHRYVEAEATRLASSMQ